VTFSFFFTILGGTGTELESSTGDGGITGVATFFLVAGGVGIATGADRYLASSARRRVTSCDSSKFCCERVSTS